jgi:hypothetical protein
MHDTVTESEHGTAGQQVAPELQDFGRGAAMIEFALVPAAIGDSLARGVAGLEVRGETDVLDLSAKQPRAVAAGLVEGELDAR